MTNRWTFVLAGLALILLALIIMIPLIGRDANQIRLDLPAEPNRIIISNSEGEVTLERVDSDWVVASFGVPASPARVRAITAALEPSRSYPLVATNAASGQFGLDGRRTVTVEDASLRAAVTLGGAAADGRNIYARIEGAGDVFLLPADVAAAASGSRDAFRDPVVARWTAREVRGIRLYEGERPVAILAHDLTVAAEDQPAPENGDDVLESAARVERIAREWSVERSETGIEPYQIENMLQELDALTASGFLSGGEAPHASEQAVARLEIFPAASTTVGPEPILLTVYARANTGYRARLSSYDTAFLLPERKVRRLLMGMIALPD